MLMRWTISRNGGDEVANKTSLNFRFHWKTKKNEIREILFSNASVDKCWEWEFEILITGGGRFFFFFLFVFLLK